MSYSIAPSEDGKIIVIRVEGNVTRQHALEWTLKAHALGQQVGIHRYLVDVVHARNTEYVSGNYVFAYEDMQTHGLDRHAIIAALAAPDDHSHDFVETVMINAGVSFKLFRDRDQAMAFLLA